jgi:hypothetical protein
MKTEIKNFYEWLQKRCHINLPKDKSFDSLYNEFLNSEQSGEAPTIKENEDKRKICDRYNHRCDEAFNKGKDCSTCVYFNEL